MKNFIKSIFVLVIAYQFTACSTVLNTTTQNVSIRTNPENAKITIDGKRFGNTPQNVNLERGSNHLIKIELDGYENYETQLTRKISFWFWGNVLNGLVPGMVTDMFTGAMYNILPEEVNVDLVQAKEEEKTKKR